MAYSGGVPHGAAVQPEQAAHEKEQQRVLQTAMELHQQGKLQQAEQLYLALLSIDPQHADALHLLGLLANQVGRPTVACELIERALAERPDVVQFQVNYGIVLQAAERPGDAVAAYRRALEIEPDSAPVYENLGVALHDSGDLEAAERAWRRAIAVNPAAAIAHKNLGTLCNWRGDTDAARMHFETLVACDPVAASSHEKLATALLREGDFERGWDEYEWRFCSPSFAASNPPAYAPFPKWTGATLRGRTILVTAEQGVGDEVMFAACFGQLIEQAAQVIVQCDARLVTLFKRSFPAARVLARGALPDDVVPDCRISAGSLPRLLQWGDESTAQAGRWLRPDVDAVRGWRDTLAQRPGEVKIGLSWTGGSTARATRARSIELESLRSLLSTGNASFISVQYGDHHDAIESFNAAGAERLALLDGIDPLTDLDGFCALLSALDLVVTVDNSTAHLAGALGVPTWLLLPAGADWRWQDGSDVSRWYPSVQLLRQDAKRPGDWTEVLARASTMLAQQAPRDVLDCVSDADTDADADADADAAASQAQAAATPSEHALLANAAGDTARVIGAEATGRRWALLNDTTHWYHWGCTATSLALHHQLRSHGSVSATLPIHAVGNLHGLPTDIATFDCETVFDAFRAAHPELIGALDDADAVCINGEGTLHRLSQPSIALLYLAYVSATRLDKPVQIVNHSCYPDGLGDGVESPAAELYRKVYRTLDRIAVREPVSAALLREMGLHVHDSFDCLGLYVDELWQPGPRDDAPYAVLSGCALWSDAARGALTTLVARLACRGIRTRLLLGANAFPASDELAFARSLLAANPNGLELHWAHSESDWLDVIAGARVLVSGRFHHSIAAAFTATPFVVWQSNTPKIDGLLARLELDALVAAPPTWTAPQAAEFETRMWAAVQQRLDAPNDYCLKDEVRGRLNALAGSNVAAPGGTPMSTAAATAGASPILRA